MSKDNLVQFYLDQARNALSASNGLSEEEYAQEWHSIEREQFAADCGGDREWMAERRMEAMMLGDWDYEHGHTISGY